MIPMIVAFAKQEQAKNIKSILARGGFPVTAVCTLGAHVLQAANELGDGIVLCGTRLPDMVYQQLYQDLPPHFRMLLLASPAACAQRPSEEILGLPMPLKVQELWAAVSQLEEEIIRRKKRRRQSPRRRTGEEEARIMRAKELLMKQKGLSEEEAHRCIQKLSMDSGRGLAETAEMILSLEEEKC